MNLIEKAYLEGYTNQLERLMPISMDQTTQEHESRIAICTSALALNLCDHMAVCIYSIRGVSYILAGRPSEAVEDYSRAIQLEPEDPDWYQGRRWAYENLGNIEAAKADWDIRQSLIGRSIS